MPGDAGDFLSRKSPAHPKNLNQWFVGEDIILPLTIPLRKQTGERGTRETFLEESFPNPSKNLLKGYGSKDLSRGILPTAKLWWIFAEDSRVCKHPLLILGQNPPEFSPAGENSVTRQGQKPFNLKAAFAYRSNIKRSVLVYPPCGEAALHRAKPCFIFHAPKVRFIFTHGRGVPSGARDTNE